MNNIFVILIALWGLVFFLLQVILESNRYDTVRPWASQEWLVLWFAITDVLSDIAVLTLPYPCIRKLQMNRRFKVELTFIFLLGTLWVGPSPGAWAMSIAGTLTRYRSLVFGVVRLYFVAYRFTSMPPRFPISTLRTPLT